MSDGPTHFVSFSPTEGKKAKRQLIPSSANDDTDTNTHIAQQIKERREVFFHGYDTYTNRVSRLGLVVWDEERRECGERQIPALGTVPSTRLTGSGKALYSLSYQRISSPFLQTYNINGSTRCPSGESRSDFGRGGIEEGRTCD